MLNTDNELNRQREAQREAWSKNECPLCGLHVASTKHYNRNSAHRVWALVWLRFHLGKSFRDPVNTTDGERLAARTKLLALYAEQPLNPWL